MAENVEFVFALSSRVHVASVFTRCPNSKTVITKDQGEETKSYIFAWRE